MRLRSSKGTFWPNPPALARSYVYCILPLQQGLTDQNTCLNLQWDYFSFMHSSAYMQTLKFLSKVWVKCFHHLVNHPAWHFMRRSKCASASVFLGDGANRFVWELFVTAFQNIQLFILWEWQVFKCKGVQRELQLQLSRLGGGVAGSRLSSCLSLIFSQLTNI